MVKNEQPTFGNVGIILGNDRRSIHPPFKNGGILLFPADKEGQRALAAVCRLTSRGSTFHYAITSSLLLPRK